MNRASARFSSGTTDVDKPLAPQIQRDVLFIRTVSNRDRATFEYSLDGRAFLRFGPAFEIQFGRWTGDRLGFFGFIEKEETGHLDVDYFRYDYDGPMGPAGSRQRLRRVAVQIRRDNYIVLLLKPILPLPMGFLRQPVYNGSATASHPFRGFLMAMTVRDVIRLIEADGWKMVATRGSHRQFKHPSKPGRVTIAGHPKDELAPGTLNSILRQAGLKE